VSGDDAAEVERQAHRRSMAGYLALATLGVAFALLTGSQAILLDGTYSLISFLVALLAARIAALADRPGSERFPYGYAAFEPFVATVRGLLVLTVCVFAIATSVGALLGGGRAFRPGLALVYSGAVGALCFLVFARQRASARRTGSPLLAVDARTWLVDATITAGVGLAFVVAVVLERLGHDAAVRYVDPVVVTVLCLALLPVPIATIRRNVLELLQRAPPDDVRADVEARVDAALAGLPLRSRRVRAVRVGRTLYVTLVLVVADAFPAATVPDLDRIRARLADALADVASRLTLDVVFTAEEAWAGG
jgi:predicted Co/Zn/Cd cation transporter (cation efflux family)